MKRILALFAALALLAGCAAAPPSPTLAAAPDGAGKSRIFGTLASFGTFEMELAPAYTRLAVLRHRAASQLTQGRIDVAAARQVQAHADAARTLLDQAHSATLAGKVTDAARARLKEARERIEQGEKLLEARK